MSDQPLPEEYLGQELTLLDHLNELRVRVTWAVGGVLVTTIISFAFATQIIAFMLQHNNRELQLLGPTDGIETFFRVSLMSGAILAMPFILYQLWLFISPGLTPKERRSVYVFIPSTLLLFGLGILFSWYVLLPAAISFLASFLAEQFRPDWTAELYISFVTRMVFWIGLSFEMPVILYFMARMGIITAKQLREHWRIAVVGIAVLAAAITPSVDPITMLLTMLPLIILYGLSILLARVGQRQFEKSVAIE